MAMTMERRDIAARRPAWLGWIGDLVYPPVCPACGVRTGSHGGFCAACWVGIRFIERPFCEILGRPFSFDHGEGAVCAEAIAEPPVFDRLRAAAIHDGPRSEEHTSELQSLMRHSYAVFCLKKKKN